MAVLDFMMTVADAGPAMAAPVLCRGESLDSGTCGRMAYRFSDFDAIRGYDQDFFPVGYQDVDLRVRFKEMQKRASQKNVIIIDNVANFGGAVPNDAADRKVDRNWAKITEVDQNILQSHGTTSWGKMNAKNIEIGHEKMKRGEIIRNETFDCDRERLGCWWRPISREELQERRKAEAQDPIGAHPSFSIGEEDSAFQPPSRGRGPVPPQDEPRPSTGRWMAPSLAGAPSRADEPRPSSPAVLVRVATAGLARPPCEAGALTRTARRVVARCGMARSAAPVMLHVCACGVCVCLCVCVRMCLVARGHGWQTWLLARATSTKTL